MTAIDPTLSRPTNSGADRPTILFVDDDEQVLLGLRAVLRRRLSRHRLLFAHSAEEALGLLETDSVDLVVTDAQMPGVDGVCLLESIRQDHPGTIRYVLSGEAQADMVTRAVPVAHRWLSKPCDCDELAGSLRRALIHRRNDVELDALAAAALADVDALPTPPRLYLELRSLLADDDVTVEAVAELVAADPAVTAKVLQWANSAFAGRRPVLDLPSAITRLGLEPIASLVLSESVVRSFADDERIPGFDGETWTAYCSTVSELAARLTRPEAAMLASVGALLSSIGLLLEASSLPARLGDAYRQAEGFNLDLVETEEELYGIAHPQLGAHLLTIWGLPPELVSIAASAFEPPRVGEPLPLEPIEAVRAARLLTMHRLADRVGRPHVGSLDTDLIEELNAWLDDDQGGDVR